MARNLPRDRSHLTLALGGSAPDQTEPDHAITAADLAGLDLTRVPQELARHVPQRGTPWPRGTLSSVVETPEGRQALCFASLDELGTLGSELHGSVPVNSTRTLWVVTVGP